MNFGSGIFCLACCFGRKLVLFLVMGRKGKRVHEQSVGSSAQSVPSLAQAPFGSRVRQWIPQTWLYTKDTRSETGRGAAPWSLIGLNFSILTINHIPRPSSGGINREKAPWAQTAQGQPHCLDKLRAIRNIKNSVVVLSMMTL